MRKSWRTGALLVLLVVTFSMVSNAAAAASGSTGNRTSPALVDPSAPPESRAVPVASSRGDRTESESNALQSATSPFVLRSGTEFMLNGQPFRFGGANAYYIAYDSQATTDDALQRAAAMNLKVIRTFGYHDHGSLDGSVPTTDSGGWTDIYFQYWDSSTGKPAYNDGPEGLGRLDYAIDKAGKLGMKVMVILTDNWRYHGGVDQYITWYGLPYHDDFYRDARSKQAYKDYVNHVLNRVNSISGVRYKNDPTIMAWELISEPRLTGNGKVPSSGASDPGIITDWVQEMSAYVKSIDPNHLVAVGDEGFFNRAGGQDWTYDGSQGVDADAFITMPTIDFGVFHLYPELWEKPYDWANQWISDHAKLSQTSGKPVLLEEFGLQDKSARSELYRKWTAQLYKQNVSGFLFWTLGAIYPNGTPWPDDGFMIYYPGETATVISTAASQFEQVAPSPTPTPTPKPSPGTSDVYRDSLIGWEYQSSSGKANLASKARIHSGNASIAYTDVAGSAGLSLAPTNGTFDTSPYSGLRFYIRGAGRGGQDVGVSLLSSGAWGPSVDINSFIDAGKVTARWRLVEIPLSALGAEDSDIAGLNLQFLSGTGMQRVFIDDIKFVNLEP